MSNEFVEIYENIDKPEKEFLLEFLFQLTLANRRLQNELSGESLLVASKQMNEINHRVLNRIKGIDGKDSFFGKEYLVEMVPHHIGLAPNINNRVISAAKRAGANDNA
jgi:hypothetical protein